MFEKIAKAVGYAVIGNFALKVTNSIAEEVLLILKNKQTQMASDSTSMNFRPTTPPPPASPRPPVGFHIPK